MKCHICGADENYHVEPHDFVADVALRDPEDITVHDDPPKRFLPAAAEPVERRTQVTWCVGGKEVLRDLGDSTFEVVRWPHASIEDLERLFYVIAELLSLPHKPNQPLPE